MIRHLTSPVTDRTFYGGLLASAKKLRFGHFGADQVAGLLPVLLDVVTAARASADEALLAATLVDMLPPDRTRRLGVSVRRVIAGLLARLEMPDPAVHRICAEVAAEVAAPGGGVIDPMFPVLVRELLHDPVFDVRLYACFLIDATRRSPDGSGILPTPTVPAVIPTPDPRSPGSCGHRPTPRAPSWSAPHRSDAVHPEPHADRPPHRASPPARVSQPHPDQGYQWPTNTYPGRATLTTVASSSATVWRENQHHRR